jgi:hypothetical protein
VIRNFFVWPTAVLLLVTASGAHASPDNTAGESLPEIAINDNRRPAGDRQADCVEVKLRAAP